VDEKWLPIPECRGWYDASDLGRVRSLDRVIVTSGGPRRYKGMILAQTIDHQGYPTVTISLQGEHRVCRVHLLVLAAHVGPPQPGQEARHGPAGKTDASLVNLCYGTRSENVGADRLRDGQDNRGERNGRAVLTREIVLDIRRRAEAHERQVDIAAVHGISKALVWTVVSRASWDWL